MTGLIAFVSASSFSRIRSLASSFGVPSSTEMQIPPEASARAGLPQRGRALAFPYRVEDDVIGCWFCVKSAAV